MSRSKSSRKWLDEHFSDSYVKAAQKAGWRSRASFKLLEADESDKLLKKGQVVVDLGAAPGGWSQVVAQKIMPNGKIFALDLLEIEPIENVHFIQGDFTEEAIYEQLMNELDNTPVDIVLSDMAPNMSGNKTVDQTRSVYLCELALDFAKSVLKEEGVFLVKVFQGAGLDDFIANMKPLFKKMKHIKPKASRDRSREYYLLGTGFLGDK